MAIKKYLSLDRLTEYDALIKTEISTGDDVTLSAAKSYTDEQIAAIPSVDSYTKSEIDTQVSGINTSITNIVNGDTKVGKASQADTAASADRATNAMYASQADADDNGDVISTTYETKSDASDKLTEAKTYTDTVAATKSDSTHNHDDDYDAKGSADTALNSANSYTDSKVSNMVGTSTVATQISNHDTSTSAHNDIRALITDLTTKLNNFLDVDDTTTDQLSEVLTLINNNKGTLESLTTSKVNVADIVDNLTTNSTDKVLSAAQGVAIKNLIDALQTEVDGKAASVHTHAISDVTNLQSSLEAKVPTTRTVNGKVLSENITLSASDVGADASGSASAALASAQTYTDEAVAQKTQVQIIIWGDDD